MTQHEQTAGKQMPLKKRIAWITLIALVVLLFAYVLYKPPFDRSETIATVNGQKITKDDLYNEMLEIDGGATLQSLIMLDLLEQEAARLNIKVTDEELDEEINKMKQGMSSEAEFEAQMQQSGLTIARLKKQIKPNLVLEKIFAPQIEISDEDMTAYYEEHKADYTTPEQADISHIVVNTKEEADEIWDDLHNGADFAAIAKEKSIDTFSKDKGGDLGFITRNMMGADFDDVAFDLETGEISDVVELSSGFSIIKMNEKQEAVVSPFDEVKEQVHQAVFEEELSKMLPSWMADLQAKAKIENHLEF